MTLATDYASLQAAAARWAGGSSDSLFEEVVRDSIRLAELDLDRQLWVPERISRMAANNCTGEYEALPPDFSAMITVRRVTSGGQEQTMMQQPEDSIPGLQQAYAGAPAFYALVGRQIQFAPIPTVASPASIRFVYYALIPRMQDPSACTAILEQYGDVYLYTTLKHLAPYADDAAGVQKWRDLSDQAIQAANRSAVIRDAVLA